MFTIEKQELMKRRKMELRKSCLFPPIYHHCVQKCHKNNLSMVVIKNVWIVKVYPSTSWEPICSTCHIFLFFFVYPGSDILWATRRVFLKKNKGRLSYRCTWSMFPVFSGVLLVRLLLLRCRYSFGYLLCASVFPVWFPWLLF